MRHSLVAAILGGALCAVSTFGSVFLRLQETEIISNSRAVVIGEVTEIRSFWNYDWGFAESEVDLAVEDVVIGYSEPMITVKVIGGEINGRLYQFLGAPTFKEKRRYLLFLHEENEKKSEFKVFGYSQGQYQIVVREGNEMAVPMSDNGVVFMDKNGNQVPGSSPRLLKDFKMRIQEVARELGLL